MLDCLVSVAIAGSGTHMLATTPALEVSDLLAVRLMTMCQHCVGALSFLCHVYRMDNLLSGRKLITCARYCTFSEMTKAHEVIVRLICLLDWGSGNGCVTSCRIHGGAMLD